jgi:hypothetical protein
MKMIWSLVAISLLLCSTTSAFQGGGGESTKKGSTNKKAVPKKKTSGAKSANTTPPRPPAPPAREEEERRAPPKAPMNAGPTKYAKAGNEGNVRATENHTGTAPTPAMIDTSQDGACVRKNPNATAENVVVHNGKLANVLVYVGYGTTANGNKISDYSFDAPGTPAILDRNGCHYKPRVVGLQVNQNLSIKNSDPTTHNFHPTPRVNLEWNWTQPNNSPDIVKRFTRAEVLIPVKCNVHRWMRAWIGVFNHPFFGVSGEDGSFQIEGLPPGEYTIVAWHEDFGAKTGKAKVDANRIAIVDFSYDGSKSAALNRSLQIMPVIKLP